ncbi:hypothetical protein [Burkholderia ubonensis]|uniref:hypothetical protein n=1 Tax=Burkholderia ubonensis TaxID=101571 RepID=UPI0012BA9632|nr:hypothetical protein [Burkholderia ubonensis]
MNFLAPYAYLCLLSAWGIAQNLEGLGIFKYFNEPVRQIAGKPFMLLSFDPAVGVSIISVITTLVLLTVFYLNVRACFAVGRKLGIVSISIWVLPGLLSIFGCTVDAKWFAPDVFRFAVGFPGGVGSAAANLGIALVFGWSVAILYGGKWDKNKLKNVYDHFWYPLGLAAVLYFVVDSGLPFYKADANEEIDRQVAILNLYKDSAKNIGRACAENKYIAGNAIRLCSFQKGLSDQIFVQLNEKRELRGKMDVPDWLKTLSAGKDEQLLRDIDFVNQWACADGNIREFCLKIPLEDVLSSKNPDESYVFLPPDYAAIIIKSQSLLKGIDGRIGDIERGHNIRYFAFLAVGLLAGGKVANATRALLRGDVVKQKSLIIGFLKIVYSMAAATFICLRRGLNFLFAKFRSMPRSGRAED